MRDFLSEKGEWEGWWWGDGRGRSVNSLEKSCDRRVLRVIGRPSPEKDK